MPSLRTTLVPLHVFVIATVLFSACAPAPRALSTTDSTPTIGAARQIVLKLAHGAPESEPYHVGAVALKTQVEAATRERLSVQIFPNNQMGNERDVLEGLKLGTIDMQIVASASVTNFVPDFAVFDLPFIWRDHDAFLAALDGDVGKNLAQKAQSQGFRVLGWYELGPRHIMTRSKVINTFSDLRGLKIRTIPNPVQVEAFAAYGANPTPIAYTELYSALQQGVVDGAEAGNHNYVSQKFYEVAPNWAMVSWVMLAAPVLISERSYANLPRELQEALTEAVRQSVSIERQESTKQQAEALESAIRSGAKIVTTEPDRAPFVAASRAVWKKWEGQVGSDNLRRVLGPNY